MKKSAFLVIAVLVVFCSIFAAGCLGTQEPPVTTASNPDGTVTVTTVINETTYTETYLAASEPIVGIWESSVSTEETEVAIVMNISGDGTAEQVNTSADGESFSMKLVWAKIGNGSYYFFYSDTAASGFTGFSADFDGKTGLISTMDGIVLHKK